MCSILFIGFQTLSKTLSEEYTHNITALCEDIASQILTKGESVVAIREINNFDGSKSAVGNLLQQQVYYSLLQVSPDLQIVDRKNLLAILSEQDLANSGLTDRTTSAQVGMLISADVVINGNVKVSEQETVLSLNAVDVETAILRGASSVRIPTMEVIRSLEESSIADSSGALILTPTISSRRLADRLIAFFIQNWPWIWTVLIIPLFGWLTKMIGNSSESRKEATS